MLFGKKQPVVTEVKLSKQYKFMYECFLLTTHNKLYLFLEEENGLIDAITFNFRLYKFGFPNDEVLNAHPMYKHGLISYGIYEVQNSPWIEEIKIANSIHPRHSDSLYDNQKHYILSYKDDTLEVMCREMKEVVLKKEDIANILAQEIKYIGKN